MTTTFNFWYAFLWNKSNLKEVKAILYKEEDAIEVQSYYLLF